MLTLKCIANSTADIVNWYWTQDINDAGINGTALLDHSSSYDVTMFGTNHKQLHFTVSSSTLGYYWCEISNAVNVSLRPSTITPVCLPTGSSTNCTDIQIATQHNFDTVCVEEGQSDFAYTAPSSSTCGEVNTINYCRHSNISTIISTNKQYLPSISLTIQFPDPDQTLLNLPLTSLFTQSTCKN